MGPQIDDGVQIAADEGGVEDGEATGGIGTHGDVFGANGGEVLCIRQWRSVTRPHIHRDRSNAGGACRACSNADVKDVGFANEVGNEARPGSEIDLSRRSHLDDPTTIEDGHLITHRHGLILIVCHKDEGDVGLLLQSLQFQLHPPSELEIKC